MKKENYDDYYIPDLAQDLSNDYTNVKTKISKFKKIKELFEKFQTVWGFVTIGLFVFYGVKILMKGEVHIAVPITVFAVSFLYAVALTILTGMGRDGDKEIKKDTKTAKKVFKYAQNIIKFVMLIITLLSVNLTSASGKQELVITLFSIFWMLLSVFIDVVIFVITKILNNLKDFCLREIERTKAAMKNTINVPGKVGAKIGEKIGDSFGKIGGKVGAFGKSVGSAGGELASSAKEKVGGLVKKIVKGKKKQPAAEEGKSSAADAGNTDSGSDENK